MSGYGLPAKTGAKWEEAEIRDLLRAIRLKTPLEEIAIRHQRTTGAIRCAIRKLAVDYHREGRELTEITKFTGLTEEEAQAAITRAIAAEARAVSRVQARSATTDPKVVDLLVEIRDLLAVVVDRLGP